ncbi:type II toxin-antitoxin system VapC family toxin [Microbacterium sp. NPDC055903]
MSLELSNLLLLDTNVLSPEKLAENVSWNSLTLVTASTSAQEVLGMQRPDRDARYRYALPVVDSRLRLRAETPPDQYLRWASEHAKYAPVSRQTDSRIVPASRLRGESRELGHTAIAIAHEKGQDRLFRAFASRGLRAKQLGRVLEKWEFMRSELDAVIPLDDAIVARAIALANQFVNSGLHVKGTIRNTMNDMYVAATSLVTGIPLATNDTQLKVFYREYGWTVNSEDDLYIASPVRSPDVAASDNASAQRGDRYVNQPLGLRSRFNQTPPLGG